MGRGDSDPNGMGLYALTLGNDGLFVGVMVTVFVEAGGGGFVLATRKIGAPSLS